jgi:ATP-dependent helicase/nuclease subunit A
VSDETRSMASRAAARSQGIVSDPNVSAWVDASAGSGKTKVLTDRALRLMLAYGRPDRILCLTFTKAAAAEMANRIVARLAQWTAVDEMILKKELLELNGAAPSDDTVGQARSLFAKVVDAPGGLKVQTVHSFCQGALERFPIEAGAPPSFEALDERAAADLLTSARDDALRSIMGSDADAVLVAALDRIVLRSNAEQLDGLISALLSERARLETLGGVSGAIKAVLKTLGFADEPEVAGAFETAASLDDLFVTLLNRLVTGYAQGTPTLQKRGLMIKVWLEAEDFERAANLGDLYASFFTQGGEGSPYSAGSRKKAVTADGGLEAIYMQAEAHILASRDRLRRAERALDTVAALRLAGAVGVRYARLKATRAALDFDDLILKTRDLLVAEGGAGWALYKLDQGIDHILVDEAQDTNPEQWQVVHALAGEFFQQEISDVRTIFAVGDPKQSIFSFQRADPAEFQRSRERFEGAAYEARQTFEARPLDVSFRSVPAILKVVDAVFAEPPALTGLTPNGEPPRHQADRAGFPGRVELWPPMPAVEAEAEDSWTPLTAYPPVSATAEARLAETIADEINRLLLDPDLIVGRTLKDPVGRRLRAGDIMVVVSTRRAFGDALARGLKRRNIPTAGVDRMRLSRQLVVRDLMALGQVAVLPEDDLSLACLLKSPLCGVSEKTLFELAYDRGKTPLWQRLRQAALIHPESDVAEAWALVEQALARADYAPPFDFYQWVLGPQQGRAKLVAAMGVSALDPIEEFVALALRYAADRPASLTAFLAWIERDSIEIKRELEGAVGVRLMTAHASKGLQAPVVILPDTTRGPGGGDQKLYWATTPDGLTPILGASSQGQDPEMAQGLREAREASLAAEKRRLLYVAMTRAEDRLIVAGWTSGKGDSGRQDGSWHALVEAGLARLPDVQSVSVDYSDAPKLIYDDPGARLPAAAAKPSASVPPVPSLPDWWDTPLAPTEAPAAPLAPSGAVVDDAEDPPAALSPLARGQQRSETAARFGRGILIHKLLERLPGVPLEDCRRVGEAYLRRAAGLTDADVSAVLDAALTVLADPAFAAVFAPEALAEAPIAGVVGGRQYAGIIDRLAIAEDHVAIVDFKTNRPPPAGPSATPPAYLKQMALYRALARQAYPTKTIRTALLWTEAPRLDVLDDALLDAFAPGA